MNLREIVLKTQETSATRSNISHQDGMDSLKTRRMYSLESCRAILNHKLVFSLWFVDRQSVALGNTALSTLHNELQVIWYIVCMERACVLDFPFDVIMPRIWLLASAQPTSGLSNAAGPSSTSEHVVSGPGGADVSIGDTRAISRLCAPVKVASTYTVELRVAPTLAPGEGLVFQSGCLMMAPVQLSPLQELD